MVDSSEEYVLQWEGHARHVTERFSGLLARQSFVDVTLICEEQRLRVHKLVLASCSLYFEEMLEQDLGQEPTILLSDLNFEVLKAMVEFMYCGETCVSEQHLQPLLHAARVFKVKELACIAENMMGPASVAAIEVGNYTEFLKEEDNDLADENGYSLFSDNDSIQTSRWSTTVMDEFSRNQLEKSSDSNVKNLKDLPASQVPLSLVEIACRDVVKIYKETPSLVKIHMQKMNHSEEKIDDIIKGFAYEKNEPVVHEQCCDFVNTDINLNESIVSSCQLPQFRTERKPSPEFEEVTRTVDKCLKVYTHKRRKSVEGVEKPCIKTIEDIPELQISDNCIDLIEEPSKTETELESDYVLSINNENMETLEDLWGNTPRNLNKEPRKMKEIFSNENRMISNEKLATSIFKSNPLCVPVLRRSVRLSHQENEDSINNNNDSNNSIQEVDKTKHLKKESLKRRNREADVYCELDENDVSQNSARSLRSNSNKLVEHRNSKARLSLSKSNCKGEQKSRINNRTSNSESCDTFTNKFNTIATVSRALWGDMSDCLENTENNIDSADYSPNKEIPFAVGLLPLRAALERMQATPDYQPRKTRSSVTPFRQEFKGMKRKNVPNNVIDSTNYKVKRQSSNNVPRSTVCHVHITTSHSEPVRPRRRIIAEGVNTVTMSPTNIISRQ